MNKLPPSSWNTSEFADLEKLIDSAKDFVQPSEMLRPKVVEAARELDTRQLQLVKIRNLLLCTMAVWMLVGLTFWGLHTHRKGLIAPSSSAVEQMSLQYASRNRYSRDWGMVDVFWQLRGGNYQDTSPASTTPPTPWIAPDP
jgi:hypothetical protein